MSTVKVQTAAGNSLSCVSLEAFGMELRSMNNVADMPTFIPKNIFGKETYLPVLEPLEQFDINKCPRPGKDFEYVFQLIEDFKQYVEQYANSTEKVVEIEYCGFRYLWRPKHKTHYGTYGSTYLLQPIIARYFLYCMPTLQLDVEAGALPYKYNHMGTGKGIFNPNMKFDADLSQELDDIVVDTPREDKLSDGIYTHMNSITGFNRAMSVAKVGVSILNSIDAALKDLKEDGYKISFNAVSILDKVRYDGNEHLCLIRAGRVPEGLKNIKVVTSKEVPSVSLLIYEGNSADEALETFKTELGEVEVL